MHLVCPVCGSAYEFDIYSKLCPKCGSPLFVMHNVSQDTFKRVLQEAKHRWSFGVWGFHEVLPTNSIGKTIGEAWTPIIRVDNFSRTTGVETLVKNESRNPSGTFIDRGTAVDSYVAHVNGFKDVVSASTGDYAISLSMYSKLYGLNTTHYVPAFIEQWKRYVLMILGGKVVEVEDYSNAVRKAMRVSNKNNSFLSLPLSPTVIDGYRTIVFEVVNILNEIDWIATPVGDGVLATSILKGLREIEIYLETETPNILAVKLGEEGDKIKDFSKSFLTELGGGILRDTLDKILSEKGVFVTVDKEAVYSATNEIAYYDGLLVDPVGATSLAGVKRAVELGVIDRGDKVLAIVSGSPSKDTYILFKVLEYGGRGVEKFLNFKEGYISEVQIDILKILYEYRQIHLYEIWKKLRAMGHKISLQTVYSHIKKLLDKGYVKALGVDGRRKIYSISELGEEYLESIYSR
ncbi:MAG: pyridoxal-phosphate dependent enzyme [Ignisphaera sp.]